MTTYKLSVTSNKTGNLLEQFYLCDRITYTQIYALVDVYGKKYAEHISIAVLTII